MTFVTTDPDFRQMSRPAGMSFLNREFGKRAVKSCWVIGSSFADRPLNSRPELPQTPSFDGGLNDPLIQP
jgi:hypothetical protein